MGEYRVILADPPWAFEQTVGQGAIANLAQAHAAGVLPPRRNAARHYHGVLSVDEICALPVQHYAAKDAVLFMWVTMLHLPDAFRVIEAWGFRYRTTAFTWVKLNADGRPFLGLGNYTRANAELCLLGLRGQPKRQDRTISQIIMTRRREHSRKPDEQYERIMRLFDGPYLELFARQAWPGWDVWGNEAGKFPAQPFLFGDYPDDEEAM
jgi:N6-adenosine-specific RNA methylase IME4